jgi:hypothetical protein
MYMLLACIDLCVYIQDRRYVIAAGARARYVLEAASRVTFDGVHDFCSSSIVCMRHNTTQHPVQRDEDILFSPWYSIVALNSFDHLILSNAQSLASVGALAIGWSQSLIEALRATRTRLGFHH